MAELTPLELTVRRMRLLSAEYCLPRLLDPENYPFFWEQRPFIRVLDQTIANFEVNERYEECANLVKIRETYLSTTNPI
jgi:hypothetical protein